MIYLHSFVHWNIIHTNQAMGKKKDKCPSMDEWIKKMWYIHTMEYCSTMRKEDILPFLTAMIDLECIMLSNINQKEKNKYCIISLTCRIFRS